MAPSAHAGADGPSSAEHAALFLVLVLGRERYAIAASTVVEVMPLVRIKPVPGAPTGVAGLINYRGEGVPVVDLSVVTRAEATPVTMGARIIVVEYDAHTLGILVPSATEVVRRRMSDFVDPVVSTPGAKYLGPMAIDDEGMLHLVTVAALLPDDVRAALFAAAESA